MGSRPSMRVDVRPGVTLDPGPARPLANDPFRVLIWGDFRGRGVTGAAPAATLAGRPLVAVDRDNFDDVLKKHLAGAPDGLAASSLEDLHPDALYDRMPIFAQWRQLRRQLQNPRTFAAARDELLRLQPPAESRPVATPAESTVESTAEPEPPRSPYSTEGLFDDVLGATTSSREAASREATPSAWDKLIRDVAAKHSLPATASEVQQYTAVVDELLARSLRDVLRRQRPIEAVWRGLWFLLRRTGGDDTQLKFFLLDATDEELAADVAGDDLSRSVLRQRLVGDTLETPGGQPWSLVIGLTTYEKTVAAAMTLNRLAELAAAAGAPLLAGAGASLCGCRSLVATPDPLDWTVPADPAAEVAWAALAMLPRAKWVGLALPRFLLRLPYGSRSQPIESFAFEEFDAASSHDDLLWGHPAWAAALSITSAFVEQGWQMDPAEQLDIPDLPLYLRDDGGERVCHPCGETLLLDRAIEALADRGLIPLISYRDQDRLRVGGLRSLAGAGVPLRGRWQG